MEYEQLTIRLTPMPRDQVSIAIVRTTWAAGKKPKLELLDDIWTEPSQVAGIVEPWVAYMAGLCYEQPGLPDFTDSVVRPLRPPR
jgi:hypothetical protein